ncbi:hypothetical protein BKI52_08535 [marine bacterium AO1-C]|nr:hypothetical protein BKI52_08535 [marine bacterium AO1-C]
MRTSYIWGLVMVIFLAFPACKNSDNTPTPGNTTNQNLLKTWKVSQVLEGSLNITSEFSQYRLMLNEANGNKDFTLVQRDGTSITGSWGISTDETTITLTTNGNTITLSGVSISASELKYTADEQGKAGAVSLAFTLVPA